MKALNNIDPFFLFLRYVVLRGFLHCDIQQDERGFVQDNIHKHRCALWINFLTMLCVMWGLLKTQEEGYSTIISALIGPVMVFGGAWFSMSFGGVPAKLMNIAMSITFWMFTAFLVSLTTMFISVAFVSPMQIWPMLVVVFCAGYMSCVQYDTADGLKAGLDDTLLRASRAHILYYKSKHHILVDEE